jgi:CheY-like chemotaxis protein
MSTHGTGPIANGRSVLLVEHDRLTLHVLSGILRGHGFSVTATSEPELIEDLLPTADVLICAYEMPFVAMKELLHSIKARWPQKRLFLTSVTSFEELAEGTHHSIDGFVPKPFELATIDQLVHRIAA